jgi:hypothetical protein
MDRANATPMLVGNAMGFAPFNASYKATKLQSYKATKRADIYARFRTRDAR